MSKISKTAIAPKAPPSRRAYDWRPLAEAARSDPGTWYCDASDNRAGVRAYDIRLGSPKAFEPAGAFEAAVRKDGVYVRYLGVPVDPWYPWMGDERAFADLERTTDPERFPEE